MGVADYTDDSRMCGPSEGMPSETKERFLVNVAVNDLNLVPLIARAREVQSAYFAEDYISRISKRSGYRMTLFTEIQDGVETVLGYVVYRFKAEAVSVIQFAIAPEFHRQGFGKKLIKWLIQYSKKANAEIIALSSLPTSTGFYQHFGFKKVKVKGVSGEDYVEGQVYMEYRCRRPLKGNQRMSRSSPETPQTLSCVAQSAEQSQEASLPEHSPEPSLCSARSEDTTCDGASQYGTDAAAIMPPSENSLHGVQPMSDSPGAVVLVEYTEQHDHPGNADPVIGAAQCNACVDSHEESLPVKPIGRWSLRLRAKAPLKPGVGQGCILQDCGAVAPAEPCTRRRVWRAARAGC